MVSFICISNPYTFPNNNLIHENWIYENKDTGYGHYIYISNIKYSTKNTSLMRYTLCWAVMLDCITLYKCCYYCIHPIAVCCSVMYTSPEMLDCDQQGEVRLKEWNLPVTDTQCAGWCVKLLVVCSRFSSEPLSPLKLHSFSNSFLRCVRAHPLGASNNCTSEFHTLYPLPPESGYRISPRGGSQPHQPPRRGGKWLNASSAQ